MSALLADAPPRMADSQAAPPTPVAAHRPAAAADVFAFNPAAQVHVETLSSGCPVIVVDDFYADPMAVRELALQGRYDSSLAYYPGLHASIEPDQKTGLHDTLLRLVAAIAGQTCRAEDIQSDFSIVTTPAREMLANQKHPHTDGVPLAGVLYLNPDFEIGTSFFRHRPTGLAFVRTGHEAAQYGQWMQAHGDQVQPDTYAVGDNEVWEHLYSTTGRWNRLVMYPGTAFHSIAMQDVRHNLTLDSARLTQRFFINRVGR